MPPPAYGQLLFGQFFPDPAKKRRLRTRIGTLTPEDMAQVRHAVMVSLGL